MEKVVIVIKVKICFIHWCLVAGGAESALFDLVSLLDKNKFEITIFVIHRFGEWEDKFRKAGIRVENLYSNIKGGNNKIEKAVKILKIKHREYVFKKGGKGLLKLVFHENFDIVVSYHLHPPYFDIGIAGKKKIKYIHGNVCSNSSFGELIKSQLTYLKMYDKIICVSRAARDDFIKVTGIFDSVVACYNPINTKKIKDLSMEVVYDIERAIDVPVLCVVSRLTEEKGVLRLISIHKKLLDNGLNHILYIIGDGKQRPIIEKEINRFNVLGSVKVLGYKANPYPYIKNSDIVVIPSYTEGMPVVAMEALCLGIPIVSSFKPIEELFGESDCGVATEADDDSLYNGLYRILSDKLFYNKIKSNAERRSLFFSSNNMIKIVEDIYLDLL